MSLIILHFTLLFLKSFILFTKVHIVVTETSLRQLQIKILPEKVCFSWFYIWPTGSVFIHL